jgi:elongation factor 1 alpha-like protein
VEEVPKPRSKNLNVPEEYEKSGMKSAASFVVVGHVDHGKSTLMGRLLYDLGVVDEKQVEKLRKDSKKIGKGSFALAWVMDATEDERERGVTVDIATNYFETDKTRFTILDAPGHKDFIANMIVGASQADFAVLVVDASTNSFESGLRGQTKEHALLVRSMGIQRLIVAVNKMDSCAWSQDRFNEIQTQLTAFLTTANFSSKSVSFIPCSGLEGQNISKPFTSSESAWYKGPTLVAELENAEPARRVLEKPLRLTVTEVFRSSLNNPISIAGKLDSGSLQVGDAIKVQPSGETAYIKSIEADGAPADWAVAGSIAVLNLTDIDPIHIRVGDIVCHPQTPVANIKSFTAKIMAFDYVMPMYVDVHKGALHQTGRIESLVALLDKTSGEVTRKKPKAVQPGQIARVVIALENELPLEAPSRIVLRSEGNTVASGIVE